ncbi:hypothetical protein CYLTODRAFT_444302 [Cylindrobasidium torrendii FP15055 ss-10]|uniref:Uncharacterized protein n=1 Tax=Cylindrobasidium torrendii FP15055 ss-10 TaxID=1314674 RepID=A0A0D7BA28_9AGAR|nr:hypothetical protein CYLTODRAFT_444302 [Cylindrobasidium torrendii FP15055 ss-10]
MISITNLPDDVLIAIFHEFSVPTEAGNPSSLDARSPPWILTCVSRSWRALTISAPMLWAKLRIPVLQHFLASTHRHKYTTAAIVARTQRVLELTQKCKLDIAISTESSQAIPLLKKIMPIICATAPRWKRFTADVSHALFEALQAPKFFPCLEHLELNFSMIYVQSPASDEASTTIDCFRNAHALRSLTLNATDQECHSFTLELLLPWEHLTAYSTNMRHMLNHNFYLLSGIQQLHAELHYEFSDDEVMARRQVFPQLSTLHLDLPSYEACEESEPWNFHIASILKNLHAPSLATLKLSIDNFQVVPKPLLLQCNLDNLSELSICEYLPIISADTLEFLRLTPNVEVLHIAGDDQEYLNALLGDLLAFPSTPVALPRLRVLCVNVNDVDIECPHTIVKVALQRRGAIAHKLWTPLEEVRVLGDPAFGHKDIGCAKSVLQREYNRQKSLYPFYEDEGLPPLRIDGAESGFWHTTRGC